jgi:hypothetical protein
MPLGEEHTLHSLKTRCSHSWPFWHPSTAFFHLRTAFCRLDTVSALSKGYSVGPNRWSYSLPSDTRKNKGRIYCTKQTRHKSWAAVMVWVFTPLPIISGTGAAISSCSSAMQRQMVVLEYLGNQYTKFYECGWICWVSTSFCLEYCVRPDGSDSRSASVRRVLCKSRGMCDKNPGND